MLRCVQLGLNIAKPDLRVIGLVSEMFNESGRDGIEWREEPYQSNVDRIYLIKCGCRKKNQTLRKDGNIFQKNAYHPEVIPLSERSVKLFLL